MAKSLIIMTLLATLFYLVKYLQPVAEPVLPGKVATSRQEKPPAEPQGDAPDGFNPAVVDPLPDINKGYIFSEKRSYEKEDPANAVNAAPVEQGPDPLTSVLYSGSVIAGELRRALVLYQEQPTASAPRRPSPGRAQAPATAQGAFLKKQLNQGDHFLGYVLATVEPDRIVFEKGDRKVEKFLYDKGKNRMAPPEVRQGQELPTEIGGIPLSAMVPPDILEALMAPPSASPAGNSGTGQPRTPPNRVVRRSQRLLGIDSSTNIPGTPVPGLPVPVLPAPGLPVPNK